MDLKLALRTLRSRPVLTLTAVVTLAAAMAAAATAATALYGLLWRPLPVEDEDRLVLVYGTRPRMDRFAEFVSHPELIGWKQAGVFEAVAGTSPARFDIFTGGSTLRADAEEVSIDFFDVIGAGAAHGRTFTAADIDASETPAVISHDLWRRLFGDEPFMPGRTLRTDGPALTVVGVMSPAFAAWRGEADVWVPLVKTTEPKVLASEGYSLFHVVARLTPGTTIALAQSRLESAQTPTQRRRAAGVRIVPLRDDIVSPAARRVALLVAGAACLVWLAAAANLAGVFLAAAARRRRDLAIRVSVGANRRALMRQIATEAAIVTGAGAALGWLIVQWSLAALATVAPILAIDASMVAGGASMAFVAAAALGTVLVCGVWPAWRAASRALEQGLAGVTATAPPRARAATSLIIGGEIAVAMGVLVGAALLTQSWRNLARVPLGFDPSRVYTMRVSLPAATAGSAFSAAPRHADAIDALTQRIARLPGVEAVTAADAAFAMRDSRISLTFEDGRSVLNGEPRDRLVVPRSHRVGAGYFALLGIDLVEGREFTEADTRAARLVAVVSESMARANWPGQSAIGRRVNFGLPNGRVDPAGWTEIVGVSRDVRYGGLAESVKPEIYRPMAQRPHPEVALIVRTADGRPPSGLIDTARAFDASMPVFPVQSMSAEVAESTLSVRYAAGTMMFLAALGSLLAVLGLFAALSNDVSARSRELAIRLAVGASRASIIRLVSMRAGLLIACGLLGGGYLGWTASRAFGSLLFETAPSSPGAFAAAALAMVAGALIAIYRPVRRAVTVDPNQLLRSE